MNGPFQNSTGMAPEPPNKSLRNTRAAVASKVDYRGEVLAGFAKAGIALTRSACAFCNFVLGAPAKSLERGAVKKDTPHLYSKLHVASPKRVTRFMTNSQGCSYICAKGSTLSVFVAHAVCFRKGIHAG